MSGGVDSSVAAALLKKQGYQVTGIFMHFWHEKNNTSQSTNKCCSSEAHEAARKVCQKLGIRLYTLNCENEFKRHVVDYFINAYKNGLTPNPCIMCNKHIKFKFLINKAEELDVNYLATGHYAKVGKQGTENSKQLSLLRAKDKNKDQSYFLYNLNQKQLSRILFPIGDYTKSEVRTLAKKFNLPTAKRPESQEICFINEKNHNDFLKRYIKEAKPGKIINSENQIIGEHKGLPFYTLGQRKGIGLANAKPYYVVGLDFDRNILKVSDDDKDPHLFSKKLIVKKLNLIGDTPLPHRCKIKIRYQQQPNDAEIKKINSTSLLAHFQTPQRAIMPGQSAVMYNNDQVIGGGVIAEEEQMR